MNHNLGRISIPSLLVDPEIWGNMITNLSRDKHPHMDMVKLGDDDYQIHFALAGYTKRDVAVSVTNNVLEVAGYPSKLLDSTETYLVNGIAKRDFRRQFPLAENIKVGDVSMEDGMLKVGLFREVPEEQKPRKIEIK